MEYTFTIGNLWGWIIGGLGVVVLAGNVGNTIGRWVDAAKKPNKDQDEKIKDLDIRLTAVESKLDNDNVRLQTMEGENKIILKANLALLKHSIDGNDKHSLVESEREITDYLLNK